MTLQYKLWYMYIQYRSIHKTLSRKGGVLVCATLHGIAYNGAVWYKNYTHGMYVLYFVCRYTVHV